MQMMQAWDANGDGTIDYREFLAAALSLYQATRGVLPTERALWHNRLRVVFNEIDTNGNGMLSQAELERLVGDRAEVQRALVVRRPCPPLHLHPYRNFTAQPALCLPVGAPGAPCRAVVARVQAVDKNKDGEVDFEEFLLLMKEPVTANPGASSVLHAEQPRTWRERAGSMASKARIARLCMCTGK